MNISEIEDILNTDKDIKLNCKSEPKAIGALSKYAELFLAKLTERAIQCAHMEKRKNIVYGDISGAVDQYEEYEFLREIIPKAMPLADAENLLESSKEIEKPLDLSKIVVEDQLEPDASLN